MSECVADYSNSDRRHQALTRVFEEAGEGKIPAVFVPSASTMVAKEQAAILRLMGWLHVSGLAATYLTEVSLRERPAEERQRFKEVLQTQLQEAETQGLKATVRRHVSKLLVTEEPPARKRERESERESLIQAKSTRKNTCTYCGGNNHTELTCFKKKGKLPQPKVKDE